MGWNLALFLRDLYFLPVPHFAAFFDVALISHLLPSVFTQVRTAGQTEARDQKRGDDPQNCKAFQGNAGCLMQTPCNSGPEGRISRH